MTNITELISNPKNINKSSLLKESFVCPVCKNSDPKYIGYKNGQPYCRRCISFKGDEVDLINYHPPKNYEAIISYPLSKEQERIANEVMVSFINKQDSLIYAVCGAGKTELVFKVIEYALEHKLKVGFAIPRRDVVIELALRLEKTFKNNIVSCVYGGNTSLLNGDIIVLTTHQLYRYPTYFDLLIMDEIDAFPYKDNPLLIEMFKRSVKGHYILMSATPSESVLSEFKKPNHQIHTLFTRYHMHPLPCPKIIIKFGIDKYIFLIQKIKEYEKVNKPLFIFVPTIDESNLLYDILKRFSKNGNRVNSEVIEREEIIEDFRKHKYSYLVTTAVLERGVTLKNLQVIIFHSDHEIYNAASLIQISGRVGRLYDAPDGDVYFLGSKTTKGMLDAISKIKEANSHLQVVL
jgi:competence protein ComFA